MPLPKPVAEVALMPLYEYECPDCGARIEVLQKLGDDGESLKCQQCDRVGLRKLISGCVGKVTDSSSSCGGFPTGSGFA